MIDLGETSSLKNTKDEDVSKENKYFIEKYVQKILNKADQNTNIIDNKKINPDPTLNQDKTELNTEKKSTYRDSPKKEDKNKN